MGVEPSNLMEKPISLKNAWINYISVFFLIMQS